MLLTLRIRDFAVVEFNEINFEPGFTAITGETGAGKSVLLDALNIALGGRARSEVVRTGASAAQVEALFDISNRQDVKSRLAAAGFEAADELLVRRTVGVNGRSRAYINGTMSTISTLGQIVEGLVDVSGQHAHYSLLRPGAHTGLVDRIGGLEPLRERVSDLYGQVTQLEQRMADLKSARTTRADREDLLKFQLTELENADLSDADEEEQLEAEAHRLRHAERLRDTTSGVETMLYTDDGSALDVLRGAMRLLEDAERLDPDLASVVQDLASALTLVEEVAHAAGGYASGVSADPHRLNEIEERIVLFRKLCRKHGADLNELIEKREVLRKELWSLDKADDALEVCRAEHAAVVAQLTNAATRLSQARRQASDELVLEISGQLAELGMKGASLAIVSTEVGSGVISGDSLIGPQGAERLRLLLSVNPGEEPQGLDRIASGGELSRFMLAVKRVIAQRDPVSTYVFDEVDAGIGGATAEVIARKLRQVADERQVLCITHLAQVAVRADTHLVVSKHTQDGRTTSVVTQLDVDQRVCEVARMLGGAKMTKASKTHAAEMMALAQAA